ncbi:hypothetical protein BDM02DRAFT_1374627 [Thelephora ganbajun]|uniref:Uncharacterized protein n=1 Tax=Thelephora ganbajun TaxID=370292 RepID=A0ACB6Z2B6_THEGA|nr:hypothetical protein BDM02DRAFT_1374627 [Thelephora ganbajun]
MSPTQVFLSLPLHSPLRLPMSQFSCDVCAFESYNATLWAWQNPWFQECSSLAGALTEQNQQTSSPLVPIFTGATEGYQGYQPTFAGFNAASGYLNRLPEVAFQEAGLGSAPEAGASSHVLGGGYNAYDNVYPEGGDEERSTKYETVASFGNKVPLFCRVGECLYWHTDPKQVRRHRNSHIEDHFGFLCPNQTITCPRLGRDFRRKDGVNVHCWKYPTCGEALRANKGKIRRWGTLPGKQELRPYDPAFHKPYRNFDGRTGHRTGRRSFVPLS